MTEEKIYNADLGKYEIKGTYKKENKEVIKSIKYKDTDLQVADNLKGFIKDLNYKIILLDREISTLTDERRKRIEEYQKLKKQFDSFIANLELEYETKQVDYTYYEDLVHHKALIQ